MKSYVITIFDNPNSVAVADRCIESGKKFGYEIEKFRAFTPRSNPTQIANAQEISLHLFEEKWSRFDNALAAFLSHYTLWQTCVQLNEPIQIFEHDAVIVDQIPINIDYIGCISLGAPSYGRYIVPQKIGVNPLTSKRYFPGAHAYRLRPHSAQMLIDEAKLSAAPTDVFLHLARFPWLQEYYPWPVEARDDFTTIQNELGCKAKHRYGAGYRIL